MDYDNQDYHDIRCQDNGLPRQKNTKTLAKIDYHNNKVLKRWNRKKIGYHDNGITTHIDYNNIRLP